VRVPTRGTDPASIETLALIVTEAILDLSRPSMQQINEGNPVSLNMVNEYTDLYTKDKLQLVPQERPWGFTEQVPISFVYEHMGTVNEMDRDTTSRASAARSHRAQS